jgi:hypothetical protein
MSTHLTTNTCSVRFRYGSSWIGKYPVLGGVEPPPRRSLIVAESFRTFCCEERTLASDVPAASVLSSHRSSRARRNGADD